MEVHCSVSNCQWWDDIYCVAQSFLITCDELVSKLPERYDFVDTQNFEQQYGETSVGSCEATCCKTFRERVTP